MLDVKELQDAVDAGNAEKVAAIIKEFNLKIVDGKITASDKDIKEFSGYWDRRQHSKKIALNSAYGAINVNSSKWNDTRIGQSTTLTGRCITRHMGSKINEIITGEYNLKGKAIIYGDSVTGDTMIKTDGGQITIEQLYKESLEHCISDGKEYGLWNQAKVIGFHAENMEPVMANIEYVMRHKTKKKLYRITTENGKQITVTEDHSIMVDRFGFLMEVKPTDITSSDGIITLVGDNNFVDENLPIEWTNMEKLECLGEVDDYVYDISIKDADPFFFGNDILVHNTDSIFFSAYPVMKDDPEFKDFSWAKEDIIALYDQIADITNASFPEFMHKTFNVPLKRGEVIKAGREICGSRGLFITKKRYAIMVFDKEGKRKDVNGKAGDIKVMGLEIKRSDSQIHVQQFLYKILESVLLDKPQGEIFAMIREFKEEFRKMSPWTVGTPKKCNNMTKFYNIKKNSKKVDVFGGKSESSKPPNIPWHVLGALNFNELKNIMGTTDIPDIIDGDKVLIVRLKNNIYGYNTIAIPDVTIMPEWLKALP
jgi:Intein splicing domain